MRGLREALQGPQGSWELRLLATLYDGHTRSFYGSQKYSMPFPYTGFDSDDTGAVTPLPFDVYFHSSVADPQSSLVLQVLKSSRTEEGALVSETSIAWCKVPLSKVRLALAFTA